jgi:hypothetical protein
MLDLYRIVMHGPDSSPIRETYVDSWDKACRVADSWDFENRHSRCYVAHGSLVDIEPLGQWSESDAAALIQGRAIVA